MIRYAFRLLMLNLFVRLRHQKFWEWVLSCHSSCFSCQYGERCRYLHVNNQQRKPNVQGFGGQNGSHQQKSTNPFGFGSGSGSGFGSQQQQKSNPFGFGTQNSSQLNGGPRSEYKPNQYKVLILFLCLYMMKMFIFILLGIIINYYDIEAFWYLWTIFEGSRCNVCFIFTFSKIIWCLLLVLIIYVWSSLLKTNGIDSRPNPRMVGNLTTIPNQ